MHGCKNMQCALYIYNVDMTYLSHAQYYIPHSAMFLSFRIFEFTNFCVFKDMSAGVRNCATRKISTLFGRLELNNRPAKLISIYKLNKCN